MRLTLRTLLAYLDDTLSPSEIKEIGEKVAESESAQELIAKIKQVTRRRRLTVPPATGPGSFEPNDVAEYLDNALGAERVAEIEKQCLESDVHLAEIGACHQILTLVLGESPPVPPKARERMYGLVKGRESIPYRKAVATRKPSDEALGDEEQLGLSGDWLKWVLPAAAALLVLALGLAIWSILPERTDNRQANASSRSRDADKPADDKSKSSDDKGKSEDKDKEKGKGVDPPTKDKDKKDKEPDKDKDKDKDKGKQPTLNNEKTLSTVERRLLPSKERVALGYFDEGYDGGPAALVSRKAGETDAESWVMTPKKGQVYSSDTLVSLPGCASLVQIKGGVKLLMRGSVPEFALTQPQVYQLDSAVILHQSKDFDLDLTLLRGRIFLSNHKPDGPAKVRLRFGDKEVWDLTLAETTNEVGVDLWRYYRPDLTADEEPLAEMRLVLIRGENTVNVNAYDEFTETVQPRKAVLFTWESARKFGGMQRLDELPAEWRKEPPSGELLRPGQRDLIKRFNAALKGLEVRLTPKDKQVHIAIKEGLQEKDEVARVLAIYGLAAIDDVSKLIDTIGDEDLTHALDRNKASFAMQQWLSRGLAQGKVLYDEKNKSGVLIDKFKKETEAKIFFDLLYALPPQTWNNPDTFVALANTVKSPRVAIAELAHQHLVALARGVKLPAFNAAAPQEERAKFSEDVLLMIDRKRLPPPLQGPEKDKDKGGK